MIVSDKIRQEEAALKNQKELPKVGAGWLLPQFW